MIIELLPFLQIGMADHDYLAIFHQILMPIASEVNIKLIWIYIFIQQCLKTLSQS